ncbi:hypothetical protein [Streptomyces longhuiensis]|uniref:hypothetical protein n=1 Tax=Streptomyces longhuiensis TaxID=2880933 RepID=UPI001D0AA0AC|nr:hypothetical protein [Streptomyces longhuiensis]UDM05426.1 hypothetical protein LGI35_45010 [Streptomyces longhuiensis]
MSAADSVHGGERQSGGGLVSGVVGVVKSVGASTHVDKPSKTTSLPGSQKRDGASAPSLSRAAANDSADSKKPGIASSERPPAAVPQPETPEKTQVPRQGAANGETAAARPAGSDGALRGVGRTVGELTSPVLAPAGRALAPLTQPLATVTAALVPVTEPVAHVVAPVAEVLAPVTGPVLRPVTKPLDPVLEPVTGGAGLGEVTAPVGISPAPADTTPVPPVESSPVVPPAVSVPPPPGGADTADAITIPTAATATHTWDPQQARQHGPGASASGSAAGQAGSDTSGSTMPQGLPGGATTPAGPAGSGSSPSGGLFGPLLWTGPASGCADTRHGLLASTAWDVAASGLLYDARGPRLPG